MNHHLDGFRNTAKRHVVNEVDHLQTKIFAHRGASHLAPENTMEAFKLAYEMGADGIETDVQLTKDGVPVLMHDLRVDRTTNGQGLVKDFTYDELVKLDAGAWFSKAYAGVSIVSLEELLTWIKPKPLLLNIELKNHEYDYESLETIVYQRLRHHNLLDRSLISTFSSKSIKRLQMYRGQIEIAWLTSKPRPDLVTYAKDIGADAIHIKYRLLKAPLLSEATEAQLAVRVYTVNRRLHLMKCFKTDVAGLFTDTPGKAVKMRRHFKTNRRR